MSLGRLLSAGKSLVGGSNSEPHYRMTDPKAMPKFGSAKNPFRSRPRGESLPGDTGCAAVASAATQAPPDTTRREGRGIYAASMPELSQATGVRETQEPLTVKRPEGHAPVAPAAAPAQAAAAPRRARFGLGRLRERGARFFGWLSRPRPAAAKPAVPRFEPLPIQGELALNRIKVMCNDLSDADLEVVPRAPAAPAKSPPSPAVKSQPELAPATTASAAPAPKAGAARAAWNRAGRLLGGIKS